MKLFLILAFPFLFSFSFSPMSQSIEYSSSKNAAQFLVQNDEATNIAVELRVKARDMDENGEESLVDTKEISVFPPQMIIPPGEKRTIRVTYNLKDKITTEKSFRVYAEQLPLKVDAKTKDQAGIKVLMQYIAALYVTPERAKSDLKLISIVGNGKELSLKFENLGNKHQLINNPVIKVAGKELKIDDLRGVAGENVLAGKTRNFQVKSKIIIPANSKFTFNIND